MRGQDIESRDEKGNHTSAEASYAAPVAERTWVSWLIPVFVIANVAMFVVVMYFNNCPKRIRSRGFGDGDDRCVARFLGRFSFQPLGENPMFGPSSSTTIHNGGNSSDEADDGVL